MRAPDPIGNYSVITPSLDRQLAMDAFAALPQGHPMVGLLELDVTAAVAAIDRLRRRGEQVSLFAFAVRSIAVAIAEHPQLNLVRHGKRLVQFDDVNVSIPIEVNTGHGSFPRQVCIRRAQDKSVAAIYAELRAARERHQHAGETSDEDRWARRTMRAVRWLPRSVRVWIARWLMADGLRIKRRAGTTLVTSVGKFAAIPGFGFTCSTGPRAAVFAIGGAVEQTVGGRRPGGRSIDSAGVGHRRSRPGRRRSGGAVCQSPARVDRGGRRPRAG